MWKRKKRETPTQEALRWIAENRDKDGYLVEDFGLKGRGVKTIEKREKGCFLLHYAGETISAVIGEEREKENSTGYRFFFRDHKGRDLCVDASEESGRLGRLVNHGAKKEINSVMKAVQGELVLFAIRDIHPGEELLYDYGLDELPWTKECLEQARSSDHLLNCEKQTNAAEIGDVGGRNDNDKENGDTLWGSVLVIPLEQGKPVRFFPMMSTVLAIGSSKSDDIIVKNAKLHEVLLEVNRYGEVYFVCGDKVKVLHDKEIFYVGGRQFMWCYTVNKDQSKQRKEMTSPKTDENVDFADHDKNIDEDDVTCVDYEHGKKEIIDKFETEFVLISDELGEPGDFPMLTQTARMENVENDQLSLDESNEGFDTQSVPVKSAKVKTEMQGVVVKFLDQSKQRQEMISPKTDENVDFADHDKNIDEDDVTCVDYENGKNKIIDKFETEFVLESDEFCEPGDFPMLTNTARLENEEKDQLSSNESNEGFDTQSVPVKSAKVNTEMQDQSKQRQEMISPKTDENIDFADHDKNIDEDDVTCVDYENGKNKIIDKFETEFVLESDEFCEPGDFPMLTYTARLENEEKDQLSSDESNEGFDTKSVPVKSAEVNTEVQDENVDFADHDKNIDEDDVTCVDYENGKNKIIDKFETEFVLESDEFCEPGDFPMLTNTARLENEEKDQLLSDESNERFDTQSVPVKSAKVNTEMQDQSKQRKEMTSPKTDENVDFADHDKNIDEDDVTCVDYENGKNKIIDKFETEFVLESDEFCEPGDFPMLTNTARLENEEKDQLSSDESNEGFDTQSVPVKSAKMNTEMQDAAYKKLEEKYNKLKLKYRYLADKTSIAGKANLSESDDDSKDKNPDGNTKFKQDEKLSVKKLACFLCSKLFSHRIIEHWSHAHSNNHEVGKVLAATGNKRQLMILRLRNLGNFKHNIKVLQGGGDRVIPVRRSSVKAEYLPCTSCYGFYKKEEMWRHVKKCPLSSKDKENKNHSSVQAGARLMLNSAVDPDSSTTEDEQLLESLKTRRDEIGNHIIGDSLLIRFGKILLNKLGSRRKNDVSQRVRQLARLKIEVNRMKQSESKLIEIICGKIFDDVMNAVKQLTGFHENEEDVRRCKKPGLALRLGHNLLKAAEIKMGLCLRIDDTVGLQEAETFVKLYQREWNDTVSSVALATLKTNRFNKGDILPLTDDLKLLKEYLCNRMLVLTEEITSPRYELWRELAEITLARVLLLNKRRSTEASKLLVSAYQGRPNWKQISNKEIMESLTPLERQMFDRIDMVQSQGKMDKKVPTLFTYDMIRAIDTLIQQRSACNIKATNKYVFANQEDGHLSSWKVLNDVAHRAGCKKPELINSISLRKYIATVCQILDLNEGEVHWLSCHLAHTVKTHKDFYRLQEAAVEIGKVSKLLLAAENGTIGRYKGLSMEEIQLDDDSLGCFTDDEVVTEDICDEINDPLDEDIVQSLSGRVTATEQRQPVPKQIMTPRKVGNNDVVQSAVISSASSSIQMIKRKASESSNERTKRRLLTVSYRQSDEDMDDSDKDNDLDFIPNKTTDTDTDEEQSVPTLHRKKRWTSDEKSIFKHLFKKYIAEKTLPPGKVIQDATQHLQNRTVFQIRTRIHNIMSGKQAFD